MKYGINNPDGTIQYDVTIEEFEKAKSEGTIVWVSYDGIVYHLYSE